MHQAASKETLAQWVSLALKKALTLHNIQKGFSAIGIYPLNSQAMAKHLAPSEVFIGEFNKGEDGTNRKNSYEEACNLELGVHIVGTGQTRVGEGGTILVHGVMEDAQGDAGQYSADVENSELDCAISATTNGPCGPTPLTLAAEFKEEPSSGMEHYFIAANSMDEIAVEEIAVVDTDVENLESITTFLTLPAAAPHMTSRRHDLIMDFTKFIMLTSDEYVTAALEVQRTRLALAAEKEQNRQNREEAKKRKLEEMEEAN